MANFVLVHGAWHGGWCWSRVVKLLIQRGHRPFTPTLTGLGERSHLLSREVDLNTHIQDIVSIFEFEELADVTLCGHSYGGFVITGAADRVAKQISSIVYLDAFIPKNGQSVRDLVPGQGKPPGGKGQKKYDEVWKVPPRSAESFMVQAPEDRTWVNRRCVPHPYATMTQPINLTGNWENIRAKTFLEAGLYTKSPFGPFAKYAKNSPDWDYEKIEAGHDIMIDEPEKLTEALIRAAAL